MKTVSIIGAGLAGCEAALQLASAGIKVELVDAKPKVCMPVYNLDTFCELVCNNSFGNISLDDPLGLLISQLEVLNCKLFSIAKTCLIKDSLTLSVDKVRFSKKVSSVLQQNGVKIKSELVEKIPDDDILIIATGPLTNDMLIKDISEKYDVSKYNFSDASSPIVDFNSINMNDKYLHKINEDVYQIEIPNDIFETFYKALLNSVNDDTHIVDKEMNFDKCLSIERLAQLGKETLILKRFSNSSELENPSLIIRRETALNDAFILVGCITAMKHKNQQHAFSLLPALHNCKIIRYGRQHRNTYFCSPGFLDGYFRVKKANQDVFIIGQLSGLDGYAPAVSSGLISALRIIYGSTMPLLPRSTMIGELARYISDETVVDFQPMCASFSLLENYSSTTSKYSSLNRLLIYKDNILRNFSAN